MTRVVALTVLLGSTGGATATDLAVAEPDTLPPCVAEWMATSPDWRSFQVAVEDSLETLRVREAELAAALALAEARLAWEQSSHPSWPERWLLPIAVTAGVAVGAVAAGN
jgi:hypothetical protein